MRFWVFELKWNSWSECTYLPTPSNLAPLQYLSSYATPTLIPLVTATCAGFLILFLLMSSFVGWRIEGLEFTRLANLALYVRTKW